MPFAFRSHRRSGLTLVEILIALSMTLIVLGVMTSAFRFASEEMQNGRALIELANRARIVEDQLRTDFGNLTVETRVYDGTDRPNGYFEYIEGSIRDDTFAQSVDNFQGDCDDILAFTARSSDGALYRGRSSGTVIESSAAEIVWFCTAIENDNNVRNEVAIQGTDIDAATGITSSSISFDETIRVHRRVLLIRPDLNRIQPDLNRPDLRVVATGLNSGEVDEFIRNNDISVRVIPTDGGLNDLIANSLGDLAIRSNRFAHGAIGLDGAHNFPNNLNPNDLVSRVVDDEDFPPILSDVGAFDVRVYSPNARVGTVGGVIVEPSDPGYDATDPANSQLGAYVDLGYLGGTGGRPDEWFSGNSTPPLDRGAPTPPSSLGVSRPMWPSMTNVWDTWTPEYESDGLDQDLDDIDDQGTNGINDVLSTIEFPNAVNSNVIDDPAERETIPPYTQPIRGMKVTLRLVERGTKQVHQISIIHSFVPE